LFQTDIGKNFFLNIRSEKTKQTTNNRYRSSRRMAPQDPGSATPSLKAVGADDTTTTTIIDGVTSGTSVATETDLMTAVETLNTKKVGSFQIPEMDRRRGWHDYQVLVRGDLSVFNSLSTVPTESTYERHGLDGWNRFNVNGTDYVVNFVVAPPSYGRVPNYRATDHVVQTTDAAIIIAKPSPYYNEVEHHFLGLKESYEGANLAYYSRMYGQYNTPTPTEKELVAIKERTKRPIALVLLKAKDEFHDRVFSGDSYESALSALRTNCAEFMRRFGDANQVRFFEIDDAKNQTELNKIVTLVLSDLQEGRGISFSPPLIRPWEMSRSKKFETLDFNDSMRHDTSKLVDNTPPSLWTRFLNFVTGKA